MFEEDLDALPTVDLLESAAELRALSHRAEARLLQHALAYADRYHPSAHPARRPGRRSCDGRERAVVLGGDGCPEILEFAIAEFGVMLGISPWVAADYLGQALALRHRFPLMWARVMSGEATPWKACRIVADCRKLCEVAAARVDKRVAGLVDSITPARLEKIIKAARMHVDPDQARAEAAEKARERGVFVGQSNEHGTKTMFIKAAAGAVARHDATLSAIADALKVFGDTRRVQTRRAEAVGIIADARFTEELLAQARAHRSTTPDPDSTDNPDPSTPDPTAPDIAAPDPGARSAGSCVDDDLLHDPATGWDEPAWDDQADVPDALDTPSSPVEPFDLRDPHLHTDPDDSDPLDATAERALHARLAQIKHDAYTNQPHPHTTGNGTGANGADGSGTNSGSVSGGGDVQVRPGQTEIYVHLTDLTLATGTGVLRAETLGPMLAEQLAELVGYGPYTVKPVIDLNDAVSVDAYEIPDRIRERVKLTHPVEVFPYGTQETRRSMDLDHLRPYDPLGPPGQTSTTNLAPLGRYPHRVKTHAHGWNVHRVDYKTLEWSTPHGFRFHVGPHGTHRIRRDE
ncbi:hypothetical protein [Kribbella kalugense]|uniref:DUF222 domain-containing protein n=1 Tax=Kribbella kalugense TaxID=2512221 RepID=A0A4R7ZE22_9ACTN|nr:hypothetical protein [Kribbella kalugense]TDW15482.1 hypothetical protein EV650_6964 [Kribbella kalugense]